ncbi:BatD family protein [Croceitalea rosinachiae]|uniref:BatD family protein n=1 Tax=Croceitalea rosinachiae TaxID=3075596 RepID=A0ABU3A9J0_9FLAO|nr:BatD family protein [Croceitalea sp. F388]MDT0606470.1 BatD family protein [Croceitalea sp. F388]
MKVKRANFKIQSLPRPINRGWLGGWLLFSFVGLAQTQSTVKANIDSTSIKIGEQIQYKITVETDSLNIVYFPEDQTFSPLEMVEALKIDTTKNKDRITLQRIYALTQFDSGAYTIPPQRIAINEEPFFTDSFQIKVADVVVDTTKQKMFDIKPLIEVEKSNAKLIRTLLWVLFGLLIVGGLIYWFFLRKKPLTEEEKVALLPPFDRALLQLKELENSRYLIQDEYKKYYSELTDIVRSYLEEDVHVSALESTTDQLIEKLELLKDAGELTLKEDTIEQFKKVLKTADLVKFAKSKPPTSVAEQDRQLVEDIVVKTKEALPEPTVEDLLQNEAYLEELAKKKQRKRIYIAAAVFAGLLIIGAATSIGYYGFGYVKDSILGHPTKELLESEWVQSSYGYPPIDIATPKVLIRQEIRLPEEAKAQISGLQAFGYRSSIGLFTVLTTSTTFAEANEPDFEKPIEQLLQGFEQQGAKNIITKQEEYVTLAGVKGLKTFGSGKFKVPESSELIRGKYAILSFGGKGFMQQIVVTWLDGDDYAEQIVERVLASVDVKTQA